MSFPQSLNGLIREQLKIAQVTWSASSLLPGCYFPFRGAPCCSRPPLGLSRERSAELCWVTLSLRELWALSWLWKQPVTSCASALLLESSSIGLGVSPNRCLTG